MKKDYASNIEGMHIGDVYVSMDGDPTPFWRRYDDKVVCLGNDGTSWELVTHLLFPAKRIHKNFRGGED